MFWRCHWKCIWIKRIFPFEIISNFLFDESDICCWRLIDCDDKKNLLKIEKKKLLMKFKIIYKKFKFFEFESWRRRRNMKLHFDQEINLWICKEIKAEFKLKFQKKIKKIPLAEIEIELNQLKKILFLRRWSSQFHKNLNY